MALVADGTTYDYSALDRLAQRSNFDASLEESILALPDGKCVWLTVVGDEDQTPGFGYFRGWYVAKVMSLQNAERLVKAFKLLTEP